MSSKLPFILFASLLISGCSEQVGMKEKPDEHEQLFLSTVDSLKIYQNTSMMQEEIQEDSNFRDYLRLDFNEYKVKYELSNWEMDRLAQAMNVRVELGKTYVLLDENQKVLDRNWEYLNKSRMNNDTIDGGILELD